MCHLPGERTSKSQYIQLEFNVILPQEPYLSLSSILKNHDPVHRQHRRAQHFSQQRVKLDSRDGTFATYEEGKEVQPQGLEEVLKSSKFSEREFKLNAVYRELYCITSNLWLAYKYI